MKVLGTSLLIFFGGLHGLFILGVASALVPQFVMIFLIIFACVGSVALYKNRLKPKREARKEAERQRLHAAEQAQIAQEAEAERQRARQEFTNQQSRFEEESVAGRLRGAASELIDYAHLFGPDADVAELTRAMHGTINELARHQASFRPEYFDDEMLRFDVRLVLNQLEKAGLEKDSIHSRIRQIFRMDSHSGELNGSAPPELSIPLPQEKMHPDSPQARS